MTWRDPPVPASKCMELLQGDACSRGLQAYAGCGRVPPSRGKLFAPIAASLGLLLRVLRARLLLGTAIRTHVTRRPFAVRVGVEVPRGVSGDCSTSPRSPRRNWLSRFDRRLAVGLRNAQVFIFQCPPTTSARPKVRRIPTPMRLLKLSPDMDTSGTPIHKVSKVVVPPVSGNGSRAISIRW